jgi:DNA repair protein RecN (Recombination protein N)
LLEELRVHGVGGIKDAELTFDGSFNVITGESGAGKSSLVRALEFISGKRAQTSHIHALEDASDVTVVLSADRIADLDEEYQPQEGSLIARRVFSRSGRGRCLLQDKPVPLNVLTFAMEKELVIQSQFAQLELLDPSKQLELVDSCGGPELLETRRALSAAFTDAIALERSILAMKKRRTEIEERFQGSEAFLAQIRPLQLTADSENQWEKELAELETRSERLEALRAVSEQFTGGAAEDGIVSQLENICKSIYATVQNGSADLRENCEKMLSAAQEVSSMLQREAGGRDAEELLEDARDKLEKKIGQIRKLKRTLNIQTCAGVLDYAEEASKETEWLKSSWSELEKMENEAALKRRETSRLAVQLRALRKCAAKKLAETVNGQLNDLAMEYAAFEIEIEELDKVRANGAENAVFMLRLPDQEPLPVGKTASGGELSRILIALQMSLGDDKLPGTLIFDEVEAGLGGRTALLAGCKLRELSRRCRTVLITHEATIAAMADKHFLVRREGDETYISQISGEASEREIARMLAGDETSREAIEHARSLLAGTR